MDKAPHDVPIPIKVNYSQSDFNRADKRRMAQTKKRTATGKCSGASKPIKGPNGYKQAERKRAFRRAEKLAAFARRLKLERQRYGVPTGSGL